MPIDLTPDLTKAQIDLRTWITAMAKRGWSDTRLLNALTDCGIISDHCVTWVDISDADITAAITYMRQLKS